MFIKTQKIISVLFLCFVFCFSFSPVSVFAQNDSTVNPISQYAGWEPKSASTKQTIETNVNTGGMGPGANIKVNVDLATPGAGNKNLTPYEIDALSKARTEAGVPAFSAPGGKGTDNYYRIADNAGNISFYYQSSKDANAQRFFLGQIEGGKIHFPSQGYTTKTNEPTANNTDVKTEQGFKNALDASQGRAQNTTFERVNNIDTLKQNRQTRDTAQQQLDEVNRKLAENEANPTLSAEQVAELQNQKTALENTVNSANARIQNATNSTSADEIPVDECPTGVKDAYLIGNPACWVTALAIIANIALKLSALVLYLVGNLFDYSIEIAVNSAEFFKALNIIEPMWAVVRDFANMTFIFVLIYLAWQILLGKGNFSAKENVMRLVLVAILINFSLFAAKAMVDASNILSLNIYESIKAPNSSPDVNGRASVSARIMGTLGLASVYNLSSVFDRKTIPGCGGVPGTILTVGIFGTILFSITSITFLIAAILFFMRMLNILILFITSPVWVWGYVINESRVEKLKKDWMNKMLGVMKFPVIYMLILYVGLAMFGQLSAAQLAATGKPTSILQIICNTATGEGKTDIFQQLPIIINFVLVIAILMYAIKYAVSDGAQGSIVGGKFVSSVTDKLDGFSKKITIGAAQGLYQKAQDGAAYAGQKALAAGSFAGRTALTVASSPITGAGRAGKYLVRQGTYKAADWLSNKMGSIAANPDRNKFMQTTAAMLSNKVKEPKVFGETKKEGEKRRTSAVRDRTETLTKVQMEQTKIQTQAEWLKKNEGKTIDDYAKYTDGQILKTIRLQLGGLSGELGPGKEKGLNNVDYIRQGIVEKVTVEGKEVVRVNQDKLKRNIDDVRKYHKENKSLLAAQKKTGLLFGWMTDERANAEIEARDKALKASIVGKATSIEDKNKKIEKIKKDLERLPENIKAASQESDLSNYDWRVAAFKKAGDEIEQAKLAEQVKDLREKELIKLDKLYADIESTKEKEAKKAEEKKK